MDLGLTGRVVLITGANRGLGEELALAFAAEGADVGLCARDADKLRLVQEAVHALGVRCTAVVADLDQDGECERVVDTVARTLGRLDILVNNASTNVDGMGIIKENDVDRLMRRVTGKATWAIKCTQAALPHLIASGAGRVIFIGGTASRASYRAGAAQASPGVVSAMGNALIAAFAKYLQEEVIADQVIVNVIHPGAMKTDRFVGRAERLAEDAGITFAEAERRMSAASPLKRLVTPSDVTPMVLLLSSPLAAAVSAQAIAIDGGATPTIEY
jgi:NAD(P)-dependent dehydrogenase (short-subunit alcohol dehydrogenase family)